MAQIQHFAQFTNKVLCACICWYKDVRFSAMSCAYWRFCLSCDKLARILTCFRKKVNEKADKTNWPGRSALDGRGWTHKTVAWQRLCVKRIWRIYRIVGESILLYSAFCMAEPAQKYPYKHKGIWKWGFGLTCDKAAFTIRLRRELIPLGFFGGMEWWRS